MKLMNEMNSFEFRAKLKSEQKNGGDVDQINVFESLNNSSSHHAQNFQFVHFSNNKSFDDIR